jgi:hypothetical protein
MRLDKIHEILAGVEQSVDYEPGQMKPVLAERLGKISEVVFILSGWKESHQQLLDLADRAGCHSTVFIVGESGRIDLDRYEMARAENIQILSADEILTEQVNHL